jgi:hypothetical protein
MGSFNIRLGSGKVGSPEISESCDDVYLLGKL